MLKICKHLEHHKQLSIQNNNINAAANRKLSYISSGEISEENVPHTVIPILYFSRLTDKFTLPLEQKEQVWINLGLNIRLYKLETTGRNYWRVFVWPFRIKDIILVSRLGVVLE